MDFGLLGPFRSGTLWTGTIDRAGKSRTLHNKRSRGRKNGQPITHASTRLTRSNEPDPKIGEGKQRDATDPTANRYRREASLRNLNRVPSRSHSIAADSRVFVFGRLSIEGRGGGNRSGEREGEEGEKMAENPQLFGNGMPVPFYGEMFVLARDGVEFHVDKIPS